MSNPRITVQEVVFDCHDISAVARFWAGLLGTRWAMVDSEWAVVEAGGVRLGFQPVPESKQVKNRVHLDLEVDDLQAATEHAVGLGATVLLGIEEADDGTGSVILADVEGNELCLVRDAQRVYAASVERAFEGR